MRRPRYKSFSIALAFPIAMAACDDAPAPPKSAAQIRLYERLGRPAALRASGDTAFTVTKVENRLLDLTTEQRANEARAVASVVKQEWPDPRLTSVLVILQRHTRLGPLTVRVREHRLRVNLETGDVTESGGPAKID